MNDFKRTQVPSSLRSTLWRRAVASWTDLSVARPWLPLLIAAVLTALSLPTALGLKLDTDLKALLPQDLPVVAHSEAAEARVGGVGYFSVLVEHDDQDTSIRFVEALADRLEASPYVRAVIYDTPVDFLQEHRLLFVQQDKLAQLHQAVEDERARLNPFFVDLRTDEERQQAKARTKAQLDTLRRRNQRLSTTERYHTSDDGRVVAMQIRPRQGATSIRQARDMQRAIEADIDQIRAEGQYPAQMKVNLSGSLRDKVDEYSVIVSDVVQSAWISILLVLLTLMLIFRRPARLVVLMAPLLAGMIWAFGLTGVVVGWLNLITATLLVVLLGLGIDHGIHLLEGYLKHRAAGQDVHRALTQTLNTTGMAVLISGLTTAGGTLAMIWADFKGFSQLGLISGLSMLTITAATFITMPALIVLLERRGLLNSPVKGAKPPTKGFWNHFGAALGRWPVWATALATSLVLGMGLLGASQVGFNDDFSTLVARLDDAQALRATQRTVYRSSLTPGAVFIAPDDATADAIVAELKARKAADTDSPTIDRIISLRDVIPADQDARLEHIHAASALVTKSMLKRVDDPDKRQLLQELQAAGDLQPITWDTLPAQIRGFFTPQDGSDDRMVFVFPSVERKRGRAAQRFAADVAPITIDGTTYHATGNALVLAAMIDVVLGEGALIFGLAVLVIMMLMWTQLRSLRHVLLASAPLGLGLGLMAAMMTAADIQLNFYNMTILAAIVGMGVDSGIHLYSRWLQHGGAARPGAAALALAEVGAPVTASAVTTSVGYLTLAFSSHPGLQSIGLLAFMGLAGAYLTSVTILPLILGAIEYSQRP